MNVEQLKEIIELVSVQNSISDFIINTDGTIKATSESKTLMIDLKYNNIELDTPVGIDNGKKTMGMLSGFNNDNNITFSESHIIIEDGLRNAKIPLLNVNNITKSPNLDHIEFNMNILDVTVDTLKKAVKHKISELDEEYIFYVEDNILKLVIGNETCGLITEPIGEMTEVKENKQIMFSMNLIECINTLKHNVDLYINSDMLMMMKVECEKYSLKYYLASMKSE